MIIDQNYQVNLIEFISSLRNMALKGEQDKEQKQPGDVSTIDSKSPLRDVQNFESSVFFTPPPSLELDRTISRTTAILSQETTLLPLDLDDAQDEIRLDFISKFAEQSLEVTIGRGIFLQLTDVELVRSSHVSKTWRDVLTRRNLVTGRRIKRFLLRKKEEYIKKGKENRSLKSLTIKHRELKPMTSVTGRRNSDSVVEHCSCVPLDTPLQRLCHVHQQSPSRLLSNRSKLSGVEESHSDLQLDIKTRSESSKDCVIGSKASKKRLKRLSVS